MKRFFLFALLLAFSFQLKALTLFDNPYSSYFNLNGELNLGIKTTLPYTKAYPLSLPKLEIYGKTLEDKLKPYKASTDFKPNFNFSFGFEFGAYWRYELASFINLSLGVDALAVFNKHKYLFYLNKFNLGFKGNYIGGELLLGTKKDAINTFIKPLYGIGSGFQKYKNALALSYHFKLTGIDYQQWQGTEFMLATYAPLPYKIEAYTNTDIIRKVYPAAYTLGFNYKLLAYEDYDYLNLARQLHFLNFTFAFSSFNNDYSLENPLDLLRKQKQPKGRTWENELALGIGYMYDIYAVGLGYSFEFQNRMYDKDRFLSIRKPDQHKLGLHFDVKPVSGLKLFADFAFKAQEATNIVSYWYEKIDKQDPKYNKQEVFVAYEAVKGKWQKVLSSPYGTIYSVDYFIGGTYKIIEGLDISFKLGGTSQFATNPTDRKGRKEDTLYEQKVFYQEISPNNNFVLTGKEFEKVTAFSKFNIDFGILYKF